MFNLFPCHARLLLFDEFYCYDYLPKKSLWAWCLWIIDIDLFFFLLVNCKKCSVILSFVFHWTAVIFFFACAFKTLGKLGFYSGSFSLKKKVFILGFSISCLGSGDEEEGGGSPCHYAKQVLLWVFPYHGCSGEERSGGTPNLFTTLVKKDMADPQHLCKLAGFSISCPGRGDCQH